LGRVPPSDHGRGLAAGRTVHMLLLLLVVVLLILCVLLPAEF
jgi:hypothetical protein